MKELLNRIHEMSFKLEKGTLFKKLSDSSISPELRLSFAPSMLYYLMGFKDVLEQLSEKNPKTDLHKMINAYCVEDAEHWRWYLSGLEMMGVTLNSWGSTLTEFCNNAWSKETEINRKTIFTLINYAQYKDPLIRLILIQVFEATGVLFIGYTRKATIDMNRDDELSYFGKDHYEEEFGHTVQGNDLVSHEISEESKKIAMNAIEDLEKCYDEMFEMWASNIGKFETSVPPKM